MNGFVDAPDAAERLRREIVARRMAARATAGESASASAPPSPRAAARRAELLPCSWAQERLWLLESMAARGDEYVMWIARRVRGKLDRDAWQGALDDVVARHEVLRTALVEVDGRPMQRVAEQVSVPLVWHEIEGATGGEQTDTAFERACEAAARFARRRFDLATAPLLRAGVWRVAPDDFVVVLAVHHAAFDGWSARLLLRDVTAFYQSRVSGEPAALEPLPLQYADYAVAQREAADGGQARRQLEYWRAALAGEPTLELPGDRLRAATRTGRGGRVETLLPEQLVSTLTALGRSVDATLFMVLMAGYQALLARWSGQRDVTVGTPVAGRAQIEWENLVGAFVNTLVIRGDLSDDPSFRAHLAQVRDAVLGAFDHQEIPFEHLVASLRPERESGRSPFFQAWLVLQNHESAESGRAKEIGGAHFEPLDLPSGEIFAPFDLSLMAYPEPGGLMLRFTYDADLFDEASVACAADWYRRILEAAVCDPDAAVLRVDLAAEAGPASAEPADVAQDAATPSAPLLPARLRARLVANPRSVAVVCEDTQVNGAELDSMVRDLATVLHGSGVRRQDAIGVCVRRGVWSPACILAIWHLGAVYVPLDATLPQERLRLMIEEAGIGHVIADEANADRARDLGVEVVRLDELRAELDPAAPTPAAVTVHEHDLAYAIFTSGSTGQPKAVGVEHGPLLRHVLAARDRYAVTDQDRVLAFSSFAFDASHDQLFPALVSGATIVIRPDEQWLPSAIPALIERYGITVANFPPTYWAEIVCSLSDAAAARLRGLRLLILGGEAVPSAPLAAWRAHVSQCTVLNAYGPTETVVTATTADLTAQPPDELVRVPIGAALGGRRMYVVDDTGALVPDGIAGELLIGGTELARGYLGRPGLTAERFVADPFGAPGSRAYRTGDRVRRRRGDGRLAGQLEFHGRLDEQVKIRGFRVELGEIEAVLGGCPGVGAAAVAVRPDAQGGQRLVGYVVPADASEGLPDAAGLKERCAAVLPAYMVPSDIAVLDALPVTVGGKLDRAALPDPRPSRSAAGAAYVAPRDETERLIAEIWAQVLGIERVGIDDGFFDLGGHSLLATMAVSRIAERLGRAVPLRVLFENPRIREFAPLVAAARTEAAGGVVPVPRTGEIPASYAQERLWFLDAMSERRDEYLMVLSWRVRGRLERVAWQGALNDVVARHEVLRTALVESQGRVVQQIAERTTVELEWHGVGVGRGARGSDRGEQVRREAAEFSGRPFDLGRAPLIRAAVWELGADDHVAVVSFHHAACDGLSKRIFVDELTACYLGRLSGVPADLPPLPVQYADYAVWQREAEASEEAEKQLAYWRSALADLPLLELPTDRTPGAAGTGDGASLVVQLPDGLPNRLAELARVHSTTLFTVLLTGFQVALGRFCGQRDVAVGTPVSRRARTELEGLIGLFVNTLVVRGDLSGAASFREVLDRMRESVLGAFEHQDVPFERLVEQLRPERGADRNPLFQVMFDVQDANAQPPRNDALTFEPFTLPWNSAKFDLSASFVVEGDRLELEFEYRADLFDAGTVRAFGARVGRLFEAALANLDAPVWTLNLLTGEERAALLTTAGGEGDVSAAPEARPFTPVAELIRQRAAAQPDEIAIVCEGADTCYALLEGLTAHVAAGLAERGVRAGDAIGVCVGRGALSVAAMLGIWRIGAVYVPLDPALPRQRLRFMLAEVSARCVLTDDGRARLVADLGVDHLRLSADAAPDAAPEAWPDAAPEPAPLSENDLAYVIFTSGSSGRPKAVGVEHGPLSRHVLSARELFDLTSRDRVLAFASLSFDASLEQLLPVLSVGGRLILRPDVLWSIDELREQIRVQAVTVMELTPAYWRELVASLDGGTADLGSLRLLVSGGEELPSTPLERWFEALPDVPIVNTYGPTEAVISATAFTVTRATGGRVPVGRALGSRRVYVVDDAGGLVPDGVAGELLIGGTDLARGYLGRPGLTAERFIADPFGAPGSRTYRTGDRVRRRRGDGRLVGQLEFLGRLDEQVKIRGFRIEPGEVQAVLARIEQIRDVAVVARPIGGEQALVAYYVAQPGADLDDAGLAARCRESLPEYMVPSAFVALDALPLTVQGKLDLPALPQPQAASRDETAPRTPTEQVIAQVWTEVLGATDIGARDDFFALGGHSLRAVAAASRLRAVFGCPVQVRDVFEHPTVERLAIRLEELLVEQIAGMSEEEISLSLYPAASATADFHSTVSPERGPR